MFHHAQGQTPGFLDFAEELRRAGHTVHTPDFYNGRTFDTLDEGLANAEKIGFGELLERGVRAADDLPGGLVYAFLPRGIASSEIGSDAQWGEGCTAGLLVRSRLRVR